MSFFLPNLKNSGYLDRIHITVCNVGSRKVIERDDYGTQVWGLFAPNLTIYGFDADPEACESANLDFEARQESWNEFHFPVAIAKTVGTSTLHVTKNPMCSSLYPPNETFLKRFPRLPELVNLNFTSEVETTTLDTFCQLEDIDEVDFLQIDVQGAELQVLEGAENLLNQSVLAVQVEVEFSPLYVGQPLFADIDAYLRQKGFSLFDLSSVSREIRSIVRSATRPGQLLWADAVYLRDPLQDHTNSRFKTPEQIFKLACVADALDFTDYALELLEYLTLQYGKSSDYNFANPIIESLAQLPELAQFGLESLPIFAKLQDFLTKEQP